MSNRLAGSVSPYLRHHADDPVDWYPWGDEAFERAALLDRPVFLSSGYEACHWCHVMQRDSFRDPDTASLLNERFVAVKVDRELRPDIDALYMDYVTAATGSGGWPMSVFLTPDRLPLLGGTYFPRLSSDRGPSFTEVLGAVDEAYRTDRARLRSTAEAARLFLEEQAAPRPVGRIDAATLDYAADYLVQYSDAVNGGFGRAPKFPQLPLVEYLCAYQRRSPEIEVVYAIEHAMLAMVRGGIYDQAGGGLHRYAVDAAWRTPHFEKMLTDQGLLLSSLALAAPLASSDAVRAEYEHAARQTAAFLRREMALPGGGFCASLSAEAAGIEGEPYEWTHDGLAAALTPEQAELSVARLGAEPAGSPRAVTLVRPGGRGPDADAVDEVLLKLLAARQARPQPERDTKALTAWNAIAARGLMDAGAAFSDEATTALGIDTALGLTDRAVAGDGVLREPDDPSVAHVRLLEDAAHLVAALITAAEATGRETVLDRAVTLHADTLDRFAVGPLLYATDAATDLPVRPREVGDTALPAGASTALQNAVRLAAATGDDGHRAFAREALQQWWAVVDLAPEQAGRALAVAAALIEREG